MATIAARSLSMIYVPAHKTKWVFTPFSFCSSASKSRKLVLYSKPGCCLCDGLKEKLHAAFSLSAPHSLHDVELQVRDITSNPEWEKAYQYEIPVLAKVLSDGTEELLPRLSPRLGVELVHKKIAAAFKQTFHIERLCYYGNAFLCKQDWDSDKLESLEVPYVSVHASSWHHLLSHYHRANMSEQLSNGPLRPNFSKAKPYLLMIFLQFGSAGMYIISMVTLNQGMNRYVLVVYRNSIAALVLATFAPENKAKDDNIHLPTNNYLGISRVIFLTSHFFNSKHHYMEIPIRHVPRPILDQGFVYLGMKYTSAIMECCPFSHL
ncbi:hypothetical protein V6N13_120677 [Hibiscus sabdariffa]